MAKPARKRATGMSGRGTSGKRVKSCNAAGGWEWPQYALAPGDCQGRPVTATTPKPMRVDNPNHHGVPDWPLHPPSRVCAAQPKVPVSFSNSLDTGSSAQPAEGTGTNSPAMRRSRIAGTSDTYLVIRGTQASRAIFALARSPHFDLRRGGVGHGAVRIPDENSEQDGEGGGETPTSTIRAGHTTVLLGDPHQLGP